MSSLDQQDLEALSKELRDFTEGLRDFTKTKTDGKKRNGDKDNEKSADDGSKKIVADFDKSTQKIVNALALLSVNLTKSASSEKEKTKSFNSFNNSVNKATDAQEKYAITVEERTIKAKQAAAAATEAEKKSKLAKERANETFSDTIKRYGKNSIEVLQLFNKGSDQRKKFDEEFSESQKKATKAFGLVSDGIKSVSRFSSSLASSGESFDHLNSVIGFFGKTVSGIASLIPFFGDGLGKLSEAATDVAKTMVNQFQANLKVYKSLSDSGLASSFEDMQVTAKATGLLYQDINQSLGKYTTNLAHFGGSVSAGMKIFNTVAKDMQPLREQFRALGIGTAEFTEYQAKYMAQEGRLGMIKNKDNKQLSDGTKKYIEELDILSKLTGESRQGIQAKQEAARAETQYAATRELYKNDEVVMKELDNLMILLENISPEMAKGARANIGGVPIGEEGTKAMMQTGGVLPQIMQQVLDKQMSGTEARNKIVEAVKQTMGGEGTARLMATAGDIGGPYTGYANIQKIKNAEPISADEVKRLRTEQEETKRKASDTTTLTGAGAKAEEVIYSSAIKMQELFMNPKGLNAVITVATKGLEAFTEALQEVVDRFGGKTKVTTPIDGSDPVKVEATRKKSEASMKEAQQTLKDPKATKEQKQNALDQSWKDQKALQEEINPSPSKVAENKKAAAAAAESSSSTTSGSAGTATRSPSSMAPPGDVVNRLLEYIGKHESNGNYNTLVGGKNEPNLTNMKVSEILEFQSGMRQQGYESTAVGKYQILKGTLEGLINNGQAKLDDKFDSATQDKLAIGLLKRRGLDSFQSGKMPKDAFADNLSKEWASLPYHTGQSYYAGVGSNKSGDSRESFMATLGARTGGIFKGPSTGYTVELHGDEAVVPMNEGVSKQALNTSVFNQDTSMMRDMMDMFQAMQYKYDQMIDLMSRQADNGDKLVQATC